MKKKLFFSLLSLVATTTFSQKIDTIVELPDVYTSYINYELRQTVYVKYFLNRGGGNCDKSKFYFRTDQKLAKENPKMNLVGSKEYLGSGYDEGHIANAEDFARDCEYDSLTFWFGNCHPQTPNLNRGVYKEWETKIRELSQKGPLLIIGGAYWGDNVKINGMRIPTHCYKVVHNLNTRNVDYVLLFTNEKVATVKEITLAELEKFLGYKIVLHI